MATGTIKQIGIIDKNNARLYLYVTSGGGAVTQGQTVTLGQLPVPAGKVFVKGFYSPVANLPIIMSDNGVTVYAYSLNYTGNFTYTALCLLRDA